MADEKKFYDVNGKELQATPAGARQFFDVHGNPLDLSKNPLTQETMPSPSLGEKEGSYLGKLGTESLPFAASFVPGPGWATAGAIGGATILKNILKQQFPNALGPSTLSSGSPILDTAADIGKEELAQFLIPKAVGGAASLAAGGISKLLSSAPWKYVPSVREAVVKKMVEEMRGGVQPESQIVRQGAEQAVQQPLKTDFPLSDVNMPPLGAKFQPIKITKETAPFQPIAPLPKDIYPPNYGASGPPRQMSAGFKVSPEGPVRRTIAEDVVDGISLAKVQNFQQQGENEVGNMLIKYNKEAQLGDDVAKSQTMEAISSKTLSSVTHVTNAKLATGSDEFTSNLALNKLIGTGDKIPKASSILEELQGSKNEIYSEALGGRRDSLEAALKEIQSQQEGHRISDATLRWSQGHLVWAVPAMFAGQFSHLLQGVGGAATGAVITNSLFGKLMSNPQTAAAVVQALRTPASSPLSPLLRKVIETSTKVGGSALEARQ